MVYFLRYIGVALTAVVLASCSTLQGSSSATQNPPHGQARLALKAANVLRQQASEPLEKRIPKNLLAQARCIAVFPSVVKVGLVLGARYGKGLVSCRASPGGWRRAAPAEYSVTGGSIGLQAGASSSRIVLLFLTRDGVNSLFQTRTKRGRQIGVTSGPLGFNTDVTDIASPIVAYTTTKKGLFAGIKLSGIRLNFNKSANAAIYSSSASPRAILFNAKTIPGSVGAFVQALQSFASYSASPEPGTSM